MFLGEYTHAIDTKKRLSIPTRLRKELGDRAVLTRGPDHCLFLYPQSAWERIANKLSALSLGQADTRNFVRFTLSGASEVEFDGLGRITIPENLKQYSRLGNKAVVVGVNDRIEIWSPEGWEEIRKKTENNADQLAERLGELGVF
ncbi:MAG: cell division/cell wall cluster transcriptional repressor MraZ [Candidatus Ryanbacteria bacterium RIFCSPHIGHO2_12_FULL_47_12b]|uniref:Transcriptional regulator MraZ n=3 Tax=Parcubacteria group TaxID=1794811 RepID=A0A1G2H3I5_9BACT|nr:MAG: Protein MraZ [Parcubacteria group bacterium GW2011_GWA2_47_10b]KKU75985.1 MAG: Protein MraZ [Candidatus Giovannonibacteria bacterium GW2011_GWB1_47_6b]KKU85954.1 MAG: Protein MraZ [Parcubacteria group bacterium GW2011_GWA1_47_9]OGZ46094.1 MAG: cell division/cell wall cluster transcriptional repressor MraZ [Candidatus Ryanbacteria bacterium RIFCSPHIGHO2_01_FULL_48_80]OGZ49485.1 MAG: cell division/cell wall cluster transcriptional repressor MraZ [Candidatus Ryanbacteria bacterium RIFCSPHI